MKSMTQKAAFEASGNSPTQFEQMLSDEDVALLLSLHVKTIQRMARKAEIPSIRIGRFWRFRASQLNQWIEQKCGSISAAKSLTERV